jgi:preprotein translocase subunit YajC
MPISPSVLAAAAPAGSQGSGASMMVLVVQILLIVGVFYFLVILPARKRQKRHQQMLDNLKNGDRVVTTGGIFGTVVGVEEHKVQLRIADQVKIEIAKSAISGMQERPE